MPTAEQLRCSALGQAMLWPCWCLQVLSMSEGGKPVQTSKHMMSRVHVISNFNKHLRCNACIRSCSCQPDRVEPGYKPCPAAPGQPPMTHVRTEAAPALQCHFGEPVK